MTDKSAQIEIDFTPGLTERFPTFKECLHASVYGCGRQQKAIAADLDMSASELSRKLADNPNDQVHFPAMRLADLIAATGDKTPIYWLIEKFLEDRDTKRKRAIDQLPKLMAAIESTLREINHE